MKYLKLFEEYSDKYSSKDCDLKESVKINEGVEESEGSLKMLYHFLHLHDDKITFVPPLEVDMHGKDAKNDWEVYDDFEIESLEIKISDGYVGENVDEGDEYITDSYDDIIDDSDEIVIKNILEALSKRYSKESKKKISESIKLNIKKNDVLLGGRYKNKQIKVKEIGKDDKGQVTVNGKPLLKFRIWKDLPAELKDKYKLKEAKNDPFMSASEQLMWQIIDECDWKNLSKINKDDSIYDDFEEAENKLKEKLKEKYTIKQLRMVNELIREKRFKLQDILESFTDDNSYFDVTDDSFYDLTTHIVGLGKKEYDKVCKDPELARKRSLNNDYRENFEYIFQDF